MGKTWRKDGPRMDVRQLAVNPFFRKGKKGKKEKNHPVEAFMKLMWSFWKTLVLVPSRLMLYQRHKFKDQGNEKPGYWGPCQRGAVGPGVKCGSKWGHSV